MRNSVPGERAGFALSLLLLALALPDRERRPEACANPMLRAPGEVVCVMHPEAAPRLEGPLRRLFGQPLDPNRADAITLETLPGIGPARASAIIRERCGRPFASVADLQRVPGIGPQRIRRLEPFLELGQGLAPVGRDSVKSGTCRTTCEGVAKAAHAGPDCSRRRSGEAMK
ncbi:MAG: helix-hairpin-helix domain-containing protein [Deltaproteobacteria bacterium]|nr:helix-hairpin-helix domain-containing protein [Deltaproteobacteria bacterium]MBW2397677.1 helix-hairpin-helix domain-containing protein [Deltaproteobacteria bacterium]